MNDLFLAEWAQCIIAPVLYIRRIIGVNFLSKPLKYYEVGTRQNRLNEAILTSTYINEQNIYFNEYIRKIKRILNYSCCLRIVWSSRLRLAWPPKENRYTWRIFQYFYKRAIIFVTSCWLFYTSILFRNAVYFKKKHLTRKIKHFDRVASLACGSPPLKTQEIYMNCTMRKWTSGPVKFHQQTHLSSFLKVLAFFFFFFVTLVS